MTFPISLSVMRGAFLVAGLLAGIVPAAAENPQQGSASR